MSIPRKHHYIPITHIEKFQYENIYYVLMKNTGEILKFKSPSKFFHIRDLNSSIDENSWSIDYSQKEIELGNKIDSKFNFYYTKINEIISNKFISNDIDETLKYFFEYAIIGSLRRLKIEQGL